LGQRHLSQSFTDINPKGDPRKNSALRRYQEAVAALSGKILPPWKLQQFSADTTFSSSDENLKMCPDTLAKDRSPSEVTSLANQFYQGFGVAQDKELAVKLWKKAADEGSIDARYSYAMAVLRGEGGLEASPAQAKDLLEEVLKEAGPEGHGYSEHALAGLLADGNADIEKDERRALQLLQSAAYKGVVPAIKAAADMVSEGRGRAKSEELAVKWYQLGADAGDPACLVALSQYFAKGAGGLEQDLERAFSLNLKAANMNYSKAQHNLGVLFMNGHGCQKDFTKAAEWFRKAADKGFSPSQMNLGNMYKKGLGVNQSKKEAEYWHNKAIQTDEEEITKKKL